MKIRTDFVTNSSSSSFILAFNKDCTRDDIRKIIEKYRDSIESYICDDDVAFKNEAIATMYNEGDTDGAVELAIDELTNELYLYRTNGDLLHLGDWYITSIICSSYNDSFVEGFMFDCGGRLGDGHFTTFG